MGHIFLTGARQQKILHCPPPLLKLRDVPHTLNGPTITVFRFKNENKTYQRSQLGKMDLRYGVNQEPIRVIWQNIL